MRQFILENQNVNNGLVVLGDKDFKYLRQVLRVKVGDMVNLRMKDGALENSTVVKIDDKGKKITLQICASSGHSVTRGVQASEISGVGSDYLLFQFIPKPQKFEMIVRQATECGVSTIVPVIGEYSEKSSVLALQGSKKERIEKIVREARQQSGSPVDTKVLAPMSIEDAKELWDNLSENDDSVSLEEKVGFILSERDDCSGNLRSVIDDKKQNNIKIKKIGIVVGSEGGLSPDEVGFFQNKLLFHPIHFAVNILRCETAALYGIAAVQSAVI